MVAHELHPDLVLRHETCKRQWEDFCQLWGYVGCPGLGKCRGTETFSLRVDSEVSTTAAASSL